ncbi:hypothetical protein D3C78_1865100 [compost metagenome]
MYVVRPSIMRSATAGDWIALWATGMFSVMIGDSGAGRPARSSCCGTLAGLATNRVSPLRLSIRSIK